MVHKESVRRSNPIKNQNKRKEKYNKKESLVHTLHAGCRLFHLCSKYLSENEQAMFKN